MPGGSDVADFQTLPVVGRMQIAVMDDKIHDL
jgi:hypothetical protein